MAAQLKFENRWAISLTFYDGCNYLSKRSLVKGPWIWPPIFAILGAADLAGWLPHGHILSFGRDTWSLDWRRLCSQNQKLCVHSRLGVVNVDIDIYRKVSNIRRTKCHNLNDSRLVLQLSVPNPLKPSVKSIMKMSFEQRRQAMLQLHLSYRQFYCQLRCVLY